LKRLSVAKELYSERCNIRKGGEGSRGQVPRNFRMVAEYMRERKVLKSGADAVGGNELLVYASRNRGERE